MLQPQEVQQRGGQELRYLSRDFFPIPILFFFLFYLYFLLYTNKSRRRPAANHALFPFKDFVDAKKATCFMTCYIQKPRTDTNIDHRLTFVDKAREKFCRMSTIAWPLFARTNSSTSLAWSARR